MSTVLIVEDEQGLRGGLIAAVESLGHRALGAPGLAAARLLLNTESVDCVLLDIRLRDGDGLTLLEELRRGPHGDIPVIVATAYGDSERTIRASSIIRSLSSRCIATLTVTGCPSCGPCVPTPR